MASPVLRYEVFVKSCRWKVLQVKKERLSMICHLTSLYNTIIIKSIL